MSDLELGKKIATSISNAISFFSKKREVEAINNKIAELHSKKQSLVGIDKEEKKIAKTKQSKDIQVKVLNVAAEVKKDDLKDVLSLLQAKQVENDVMQVASSLFMNVAANININDLCRNMRKRLQTNEVKDSLFSHLCVHYLIKHNKSSFDDKVVLQNGDEKAIRQYVAVHRVNQILRNRSNLI